MTFRYPLLLLLLLVIPLLVYLRYRRGARATLFFSDSDVLNDLPRGWAIPARHTLPILYVLGLLTLIVAIARPQRGLRESIVRTEAVDIVLLVDVSESMAERDLSTATERLNRLDAAKRVIRRFIKDRGNDRIGMVAFATLPYTVAPLTLDHGWVMQRMRTLHPGMLGQRTAIGDALASAVNRLRDSEAKSKVIILLTDGMNNAGTMTPENAAQAAKALDVKVYTVGAGAHDRARGFFGAGQQLIDEQTLNMISETTGALYFRARNMRQLQDVYKQIDKLEKTEIDVEQFTRFEELYVPFVAASLILLGLERLLALTRLGRLP
jgi:Ca-activated chloride channel family protein